MNSIEEQLDRIERKLDTLLAAQRGAGNGARSPAATNGEAADIDGPHGDPEVRFVPKRWTGADYKSQKFSSCEPEFLDMLAGAYDWFAQRDDESGAVDKNGSPKSKWSRLDASRARAWSARLRERSSDPNDGTTSPAPRARDASTAPRRAASPQRNGNGHSASDVSPSHDNDDIPF